MNILSKTPSAHKWNHISLVLPNTHTYSKAVLHIIYIENPVELINFLDLCALRDCYLFLSAHHCTDPANNITQHNITYLKITSTRINSNNKNNNVKSCNIFLQDDIKHSRRYVFWFGLLVMRCIPMSMV